MNSRWFLLVLLFAFSVLATEEHYQFDDPAKQKLFLELSAELRCPKCQNQNIADSNATVATDMKRKVYQLVQQGQTKTEVVDYMKQRYGDFVYYRPPLTPLTLLLWLLPVLFVIAVIVLLVMRKRAQPTEIARESLNQAEALLKQKEHK